jgi:hypothetical protein
MTEIKTTAEGNCDQSNTNVNPIIVVKRQWNNWRTARYYLSDIDNLHLSNISGGIQQIANRPYVHGYVRCNGMIDGELAHSGQHGPCPHAIKVCITKKDNKKNWPFIEARLQNNNQLKGQQSSLRR